MRFTWRFRRHAILATVAVVFCLQGCGTITKMTTPEEPAAETVLQNPPSYGVVTNITPAVMMEKEIRKGDLAITVDLEDGHTVTIIQPEDNTYVVGDRVRVVRSGEKFSRVQLLE
ncbi:MAG: hypothetical protein DELT_02832 [Desulfovibrio sp.]